MTLNLDTARFDRDCRKLAELTGKSAEKILDEQGRLFLGDCVRATPPFTPGKNWSEPFEAQRQAGVSATSGQVRSLFQPIKELRVFRTIAIGRAGAVGRSVRKLVSAGRFEEANRLLNKIGIRSMKIVMEANSAEHKQARDKRGRIQGASRKKRLVIQADSIEKLANRKVLHVGMAKSGWRIAAKALRLGLPNWVRRHAGSGIFQRSGEKGSPVIALGNAVPYIQASGQELGIMQWAWRNRLRNLPKQVEATLKAQLRQYTRKTSGGRF